jgi:hypothetical protein
MLFRSVAALVALASFSSATPTEQAQGCQSAYMSGSQDCSGLSILAECLNGPMTAMDDRDSRTWQRTLDAFARAAGCSLVMAAQTNPSLVIRERNLNIQVAADHDVNFVRHGRQETVSIWDLYDRVNASESTMNAGIARTQAISDALATFTSSQHTEQMAAITEMSAAVASTVAATQATASNMLASMLDDVARNMTGFQTQMTASMAAFQSELGGELATLSATISRNVTTGLATALSVANAAMDRETSLDLLGTYTEIMTSLQSNQGFIPFNAILNSTAAQAKVNRFYSIAERARNCSATSSGWDVARNRCAPGCRARVSAERETFLYGGHCMHSIEPNGDDDRFPSWCIPYWPASNPGWSRGNYNTLCRLSRQSMGRQTNCGNIDMDGDGGLCAGKSAGGRNWAVMAFESNTSPDVWMNRDWWSWRPTNGGGNCQLEEDSSTVAIYACR